jgi:hypothetical protein
MILAPEVPNICASIQRMYYKLLMIILMVEVFYFKRNANVLYLNFALKIPILNLIVRLSWEVLRIPTMLVDEHCLFILGNSEPVTEFDVSITTLVGILHKTFYDQLKV